MRREPSITSAFQNELEVAVDNMNEYITLLDLIDAEFKSDPTSTQCFDARIVQRVSECVAKRKQIQNKRRH